MTPVQRFLAAVPPALVVGVGFTLVFGLWIDARAFYLAGLEPGDGMRAGYAHQGLLSVAYGLTAPIVVALGLRELARRVPRLEAGFLTAAVVALALVAVRAVANVYVRYGLDERPSWLLDWFLWGARLSFVGWLVVAVALAVALRRLRNGALVAAIACALIAAAAASNPTHQLYDWLHFDDVRRDAGANFVLDVIFALAQAAALLAGAFVAGDRAPAAPADPHRAGRGLARVGAALVARIVIAMAFAALTLMAVSAKSPGLLKLTLGVVPIAILGVTIAMVHGLFQAGAPAWPEAPRLRFAAAGALLLAGLALVTAQSLAAFRVAMDRMSRGDGEPMPGHVRRSLEEVAVAFPYVVPAVGMIGLLCLVSALGALKRRHGAVLGSADPTTAALMLVGFTGAGVGLQRWQVGEPRELGTLLVLTILVAVANVVAQLAVARLCHKVADGLLYTAPAGLPPARIYQSAADDLDR